jgi:hypothetical protein
MRKRTPAWSALRSAPLLGSIVLAAVALAGCGRNATEADCQLIVDRNTEVKLRSMNITDNAAIDKRKEEMRAQFQETIRGCVGRRVTDGMMNCVKKAETEDEIDHCLK